MKSKVPIIDVLLITIIVFQVAVLSATLITVVYNFVK